MNEWMIFGSWLKNHDYGWKITHAFVVTTEAHRHYMLK